jgi:ABC-2 type transport system permease protein
MIWNAVSLYGRYVAASIRSQMQYRASVFMAITTRLLHTAIELSAIVALFARFGNLRGWHFSEVALLYGMVNVSFALAEGFGRGFDMFDRLIRNGDFDRLLLRPRHTALQVAGSEVQMLRMGRLLQGVAVLVYGSLALDVVWTLPKAILLVIAVLCGACLFLGIFVLQATLAFWTTQTLEIVNTVTYGGVETAQYPLDIYRPWFRSIFIFVVPLGSVCYFPAMAIMGKADPLGSSLLFQWLAPLIGVAFLAVAVRIWEFGVRHYHSTGS